MWAGMDGRQCRSPECKDTLGRETAAQRGGAAALPRSSGGAQGVPAPLTCLLCNPPPLQTRPAPPGTPGEHQGSSGDFCTASRLAPRPWRSASRLACTSRRLPGASRVCSGSRAGKSSSLGSCRQQTAPGFPAPWRESHCCRCSPGEQQPWPASPRRCGAIGRTPCLPPLPCPTNWQRCAQRSGANAGA